MEPRLNELARRNEERAREVSSYCAEHVEAHRNSARPPFLGYPLPKLKARIVEALSNRWGQGKLSIHLDAIDRESLGGDLALKIPQLLSDGGVKGFTQNHLPWIVEVLRGQEFADAIASVATKGMYINLTLTSRWLLESAQKVIDLGSQFGMSDLWADRTTLVDYSSPNVGKNLHAGHIRSTIIGHVLANLHEACGALVYRVNHINDFGGFGFTLEGYRRFQDQFPAEMDNNGRLLEVYRIRRTLERLVEEKIPFETLDASDREVLERYFPGTSDRQALELAYRKFVAASDARFAALEAGVKDEVELWQRMVDWSLTDFQRFYDSLDIRFDLVLGESFYFEAGDELIDRCLKAGTAIQYTEETAAADIRSLDAMLKKGEITEVDRAKRADLIRKDIGAVVVQLGDDERYVVRRADGLSIYATRDLGAIALRRRLFHPTDMIYVVGQEQKIHFSRLFKAAAVLGIAPPEVVRFQHVYFGFYIDSRTKRKLSSRDSVANVNELLAKSVEHFRVKSGENRGLTPDELEETAQQLAIGSVVFNDLKQDVKTSVDIDAAAPDKTIAGFEKSGGAYVVYTACRARSILRKHGAEPPPVETIADLQLDTKEALLLLRIQEIPERFVSAVEQSNPTLVIRHLLDIAGLYNSYNSRVRVITNGVADPARLLFTKAVELSVTNALRACHIECPEKI